MVRSRTDWRGSGWKARDGSHAKGEQWPLLCDPADNRSTVSARLREFFATVQPSVRRITVLLLVAFATLPLGLAQAATAHKRGPRSCRRAAPNKDRRGSTSSAKQTNAATRTTNARAAAASRRCRRTTAPASQSHVPNHSATSGSLIIGLNGNASGWGGSSTAGRLNQIVSQTGVKWMREQFYWSTIEPAPGVFSFSYFDHFVLLASQRGVHLLPLLFDTPSWEGPSWNSIPADPSAFAGYVAAVVGRYGPHGSFWSQHPSLAGYAIHTFELWNEPYYDNGNDGDYDPARYANLVKAAATAGRAVDASAKFLLGAENQVAQVGSNWVWWIDALYQAVPNLNNYFDGIAVHPYGDDLTSLTFPTPGQPYTGYEQIRRLESIHREFVNHGAGDKPLWLTEIGFPTCTAGGSDRCTTLGGQASDLATIFNDARTAWKSYVQAVFVYGYQDNGPNSSDPENDYGLVYYNGVAKPALSVFRTVEATG